MFWCAAENEGVEPPPADIRETPRRKKKGVDPLQGRLQRGKSQGGNERRRARPKQEIKEKGSRRRQVGTRGSKEVFRPEEIGGLKTKRPKIGTREEKNDGAGEDDSGAAGFA